MSGNLAINGGPKTREAPFPKWPVHGPEEEKAVLEVLRSGDWGRLSGPRTAAFEKAFAERHGCRYGVAVTNGTAALQLALLAAGIEAGDEVIVPPYTFLATATAVALSNAVPIFADIHPDTYCLDPEAVEAALTPRTRAIIPVHLGGQIAEMDRLLAIAERHNLIVIEDAAHAHGARYKGRSAGSLGHMACFSFQASKNMTSGEGGIVTTNDQNLYEMCDSIHNCGRAPGAAWYEHGLIALNLRMTEFQAAVLQCGLERLESQTELRNANGMYLNDRLAAIPGIRPLPRGHGETRHAYHLYVYEYDPEAFGGVSRERFCQAVAAEGIPTGPGYTLPLYRQEIFTSKVFGPFTAWRESRPDLDYAASDCPVCERACASACWIAQTVLLASRNDMDDIVRAFRKVCDHREELLS